MLQARFLGRLAVPQVSGVQRLTVVPFEVCEYPSNLSFKHFVFILWDVEVKAVVVEGQYLETRAMPEREQERLQSRQLVETDV